MAFALVGHAPIPGLQIGGTSAGIDTTGANLLVFIAAYYNGTGGTPSLSDNYGNTWTLRKSSNDGGGHLVVIYDVLSPSCGAGHTVTFAGSSIYSSGEFLAFSCVATFDQSSSATNTSSATIQPGSITPSANNGLLVAGLAQNGVFGSAATIDSGFTAEDGQDGTASSVGEVGAYLIQTTATAVNPTFTAASASGTLVAAMVAYLPPYVAPPTQPVKPSAPTPASQGAMPILEGDGTQVWVNKRIKSILNSLASLIQCAVSNAKSAPKIPQDGQLLLARNPWRPVSGQTTDQWVYYDAAAGIWSLLATAPTNT